VVEIDTQIHKVLDLGANLIPRAGPAPLQERIASTRVSMFGRVSMAYVILYFHRIDRLAQGLEGACSEPWGANLPEEMMTPEESHIFNENMQE
jgi:hypothetical protein